MKRLLLFVLVVFMLCASATSAVEDLVRLSMTQDFEKEALQNYAAQAGWEALWEIVYEEGEQTLDLAGDWLLVSALIQSPLIRWVQVMRQAHAEGYDETAAELVYQEQMAAQPPDDAIEIGVILLSLDPAVLTQDKVDFILEDDRGQRWQEPAVTTEGILEQTYSFGTAYDEYFNVVFYFGDQEPDWTRVETLTLRIVSLAEQETHDIGWVLEPL